MARWGPTLVFGVGVLCRLGVGGVLGSWWGYDRVPGDPLGPGLALFMIATWLFVFVVLLGYIALAHRPALRAVIRRPAWSVLPLLLAAAWPLSLVHAAEAGLWRQYAEGPLPMHPPVGFVDLLAAFDGASVRASVAGFICLAALAVLQVVVFVGSLDVRSGVRWRDALSISGQILMLYVVFDSLGFPLITTAALVGTHTVTRTVMAPAVLAVGVCFFLWL